MLSASSDSREIFNHRLPQYQPMMLCVLAFVAGILADRFCDLDFRYYCLTIFAGVTTWWFVSNASSQIKGRWISASRAESVASICLLIAWLGLGAFWHHGRWNWFGQHEIGLFASESAKPCCLEAVVRTEPRWMAPSDASGALDYADDVVRTKVLLEVKRVRDGLSWVPVSGQVDLIVHAPTHHIRSGESVRVFGRLVKTSPPTNPGQFDFQAFYRARSKLAFLHAYYPESVQALPTKRWKRFELLSNLRRRLNEMTWKYVGGDEAAFASAILLGNREQLSSERRELFLETGTVHLLAISGLHVGILAGSFFLFFRFGLVSRRKCLWATIVFVIFYAWLVEFRPPVSRAAILIVLYCLGRMLGENNFSFNLLAIAGLIVLMLNPMDLFGLGPQLSFLAVATLTFGKDWVFWPPPTDPIKRLIASTRPWHVRTFYWLGRQLRTAILVSGLIWLVAMPLVAHRFHLVAPVALIVNPLLLVPIAWSLYGGLGVLVFGWFLPPLAHVCGEFCRLNLSTIEWMIARAQSMPGSHFWTSGPTTISLLFFYAGLFLFAVFPPTRLRFKWVAALALVWIVFAWLIPNQISDTQRRNGADRLVCTFIDVGHGTSVLMQLPNGQNLLYDAGSFGSSSYGSRNVASVLWSERIMHLDAVVISHADIDHFNSLPEIVRRFSVGSVLVSPQMLASESPAVRALFDLLAKSNMSFLPISAGDRLVSDANTQLSILNPPAMGTGGNDNSDSLVLAVEFASKQLILPGDLELSGMDLLLQREPIDCDVVMAAHHGSKNSLPDRFLGWTTPEHVVISGSSQRVDDSTVRVFEQDNRTVYRTDQQGAIRFVIDANDVNSYHWAGQRWIAITATSDQ